MNSTDDSKADRRGGVARGRGRLITPRVSALPLERLRRQRERLTIDVGSVANARRADFPEGFAPQLATRVDRAPEGEGWLHEIKLDGYRLIAELRSSGVRLLSRKGQDWTARLPVLEKTLARLGLDRAVLDGELVALQSDGTSSFRLLQEALASRRTRGLVYALFDVVYLDGYDLTEVELATRKLLLKNLLASRGVIGNRGTLRYVHHFEGNGAELFDEVCRLELEGIVSKRRIAPYRSGRSPEWLKLKCVRQAEFVVGGFTEAAEGRPGFGALLLGAYSESGKLLYVGRVSTGFTAQHLRRLNQALRSIEVASPPFAMGMGAIPAPGARWVRPELVVDVEFSEWADDGTLERPVFRGLREDRDAREVELEGDVPAVAAAATGAAPDPDGARQEPARSP